MKVLVRKSVAGAEYWDTEEKRSIFVPKGMEPDFEVSENPATMITPEEKKVSIDSAEIEVEDSIEINGEPILPINGKEDVTNNISNDYPKLEEMTAKELRSYAKKQDINIPSAIKTKGDILQIIKSAK